MVPHKAAGNSYASRAIMNSDWDPKHAAVPSSPRVLVGGGLIRLSCCSPCCLGMALTWSFLYGATPWRRQQADGADNGPTGRRLSAARVL